MEGVNPSGKHAPAPSPHEAARNHALFESVSACVCLLDADGIITFANGTITSFTGREPEEVVGTHAFDLVHPEDVEQVRGAFDQLLTGDTEPPRVQLRVQHKDGSWRWLECVGRNALADPVIGAIVANFWDIDAQKRVESERRRLERTLRVVTGCNQALVRAQDESDLLQRVCEVIAQIGGYPLVWVGTACHDDSKSIQPVAQAGPGSGYVAEVKAVWSDTERGQGPVGRSIRTGAPCLSSDVTLDPGFVVWREAAARHGFASLFSVPLRAGEEVLGALTIYSSEPNGFSNEECQLLEQLADDVSYGIVSRRAREEKKQAEAALRASEERLRCVVESDIIGVHFWTSNGEITDANDAFLRMIGATREELRAGQIRWPDLTPAEWKQRDEEALAEIRTRGACTPFEKEYLRRDGARIPVLLAPAILDGSLDRGVCFVVDLSDRKRIERELIEERNLLRTLIDHVPDYIYVKDLESRHLVNNRANLELLGGKSIAEATGKSSFELFPHELAEKFVEDDRALFRSGEALINHEEPVVTPAGEKRWLLTTKVPLRDSTGTVKGLVGISRDITERKRTEETLARERNLFHSILDHLPLCVYVLDREQRCVLHNRACGRLFGLESAEPAASRLAADILPEAFAAVALADARSVLETGLPVFERECEFSLPNGRRLVHLVSTLPLVDKDGGVASVIGISQDVTERRHAEQQIQKLAAFPRVNPNAVFEFGATGDLNYFNDAAQQMTALLGKVHPSEILPPGTSGIVQQCLSSGKPRLRLETTLNDRTISWSFFPVQASRVVHCYGADITERVALEAQLRQSQKMESVGLLAGGVAHDFNNILTVVQGHAALLLDDSLNDDQTESARQISEASERAANLTRQLLAFSRRQVLQPRNLDLNEVVSNIARMLQRLVGEHITLDLRYASNLPLVYADQGTMEQVLVNLAVNARDAMPKGGRIGISLRAVTHDAINGVARGEAPPGNYVVLTVSDTGCGIAPGDLERIFEPFFTTKEVGHGTGLGLATVYGIVKQHHGWVTVQSQPGKGSTFEVFLPGSTRKGSASKVAAPAPSVRGGTERVLVVEDEAPLRELVRCILENYGYTVTEAASGRSALDMWPAERDKIDLLLTDMVMPDGVTGRELAELLKQDKPSLRVVFTSGYSSDIVGRDFILEDGFNFLQKPYNPHTLAETVRDCLDRTV